MVISSSNELNTVVVDCICKKCFWGAWVVFKMSSFLKLSVPQRAWHHAWMNYSAQAFWKKSKAIRFRLSHSNSPICREYLIHDFKTIIAALCGGAHLGSGIVLTALYVFSCPKTAFYIGFYCFCFIEKIVGDLKGLDRGYLRGWGAEAEKLKQVSWYVCSFMRCYWKLKKEIERHK